MIDSPMLLIIDDSLSNLDVLISLFRKYDYRIVTAQNGEDGLQRACNLLPDLILLDVVMPGIDGFEVCEQLKARDATRDIPVIFMTALDASEHKVKGLQVGGVDYLTKPLQIDEVLVRVETQLKLRATQNKLQEQNARLDKQREELEQRVEERTAELMEREKTFRTLAENSPDYINRLDCQCRFVYANPRFEVLIGLQMHELVGKTPVECFPGNPFSVEYQERVQAVISSGRQDVYETTVKVPDGELRYHSISFVAELDDAGGVVGVLAIGRDITELKRKDRELLLLSLAVNSSSESAFLMDKDGRFVYVNDEACRGLGYTRDELLGMTPLDIDPVITEEQLRESLHSVFTSSSHIGLVESVHRAKNGRTFPVGLSGSALMLDGENYCLTMGRNISARKRAEQALAESEREFRTLAEHHPDGIVRLDLQGRHLFANPAILHMTGLSDVDLYGKTVCELEVPGNPDTLAPLFDACLKVVEEGKANVLEFVWPDERIAEIRHIPEFNEQGVLISVLAIVRDITERRQAEKLVHEQKQAIRAVLENSPDAILRYDRDFCRTYVNAAMHRVFGVSSGQLVGSVLPVNSPLDDPEAYRSLISDVLKTGEERRQEFSFVLHGNTRWADLRFAPEFDADGQVASVVVVGCDVTERRETERLLREERGLFVSGPTVVFKWKAEDGWPVEYVSPNVFEQFGYTVDELTSGSIPFAAIVHPDDLERVSSEVKKYFEGEKSSFEKEYRILHADGSYRWVHAYTTINREADGAAFSSLGYLLDITERRNVEEELAKYRAHLEELVAERTADFQESEAKLRALIDNLPFEFWAMDRNLRYTMQNSASLMNYGPVVGKGLDELGLPSEVTGIWLEQDKRVLAGEILRSEYETEVEGEQRMFESLVAPVVVNDSVVGIVGVGIDVTERKQAEIKLKNALEFNEGVINAIPDLLFEVDRNGCYLNVWTQQPELLVAKREQLLGRNVDEVFSPENTAIAMNAIRDADAHGWVSGVDICLELPNGKSWFSHTISKKVGEGDADTTFIVLSRDITESKHTEHKLREALAFSEGVINAIPDLLFEVDEQGLYLNVWTHRSELLAAQREILLGKTVADVLSAEAAATIMDALDEAASAGISLGKIIWIDLPAGRHYFELSVSTRRVEEGAGSRFLVLSRDVTERKQYEDEIQRMNVELEQRVLDRTTQLEEANAELRESERRLEESHVELQKLASRRETAREQERKHIARELHDELGQYLTALALSTSALDIEFASENTVLAEKLLKMRALVDDTKQVARRLSQRLRPAALDMGIDAALEWLTSEFTTHTDTKCELLLQDGIVLRDIVTIVVFRIVQESLTNIARHASASNVGISLRQKDGAVVLEIYDDGKGFVPSEKREDSFGLIGMRERLLSVGGKLDVISKPDCGTRIVAYIPVVEEVFDGD